MNMGINHTGDQNKIFRIDFFEIDIGGQANWTAYLFNTISYNKNIASGIFPLIDDSGVSNDSMVQLTFF